MIIQVNSQDTLEKVIKDEIKDLTSTPVDITLDGAGNYLVSSPYNRGFVNAMHKIDNSCWDRSRKVWIVPAGHQEEMNKALNQSYGATSSFAVAKVITIKLKKDLDVDEETLSDGFYATLDACFRGKAIVHGAGRDGGGYIQDPYVLSLCDLNEYSYTDGSRNYPELYVKAGASFCFRAFSGECDVNNFDTSDDTWEVLDVKTIQPILLSDAKQKAYNTLKTIIADREAAINKLLELNDKLIDFGTLVEFDSTRDISFDEAKRRYVRRIKRTERRNAKRSAKASKEVQALAKQKAEQLKARKLHKFYFTTDDVESVTPKAILIHLSDDKAFWFPRKLVWGNGNYFNARILDDMKLTDTNKDEIKLVDLNKVLGDKKVAEKHGNENHLDCDLSTIQHTPAHIEPKEVTINDSLKR